MPFITQGKTNWKFLLIIILVIVVGGGILWCCLKFQEIKFSPIKSEEKGVTITTDKTEYEQGEVIKINVKNSLDVPILYYDSERFWGIEYLEDEEWKNPEYESGGGFQLTEENINDICYIKLYERMPPAEMKSDSTLSQQWNQRICPFGEGDPGEPRFVKYIGTGHYRLIFYYGFEIADEDLYKISNQKTIYSNEFTIKGKSATADWKTYKNEDYGFEFKYPENYVVGKTMAKNNQFITFSVDSFQIVIYPTDLSLDDFIKDRVQGYLIRDYQKISFLGQDAYEGINQGIINSYEIVAKNKGYVYELVFNTNNKDTLPELKAGLTVEQNQMLSTFKFLEDKKTAIDLHFDCVEKDEETGWYICKTEDNQFEFQKPNDFSWVKNITVIPNCQYHTFQEKCPRFDDLILAFEKEHGCNEPCLRAWSSNLSSWGTWFRVIVGETPFCVYKTCDCGAGSCGCEFFHTAIKEKDCYIIYSLYSRVNCSTAYGIGTADYAKCEESQNKDDKTFEDIISTFKFLQ